MKLPVGAHASAEQIDNAIEASESTERRLELQTRIVDAALIAVEGAVIIGGLLLILQAGYQ